MHAFTAALLSLFLLAPLGPGWLGVFLDADADRAVVTEVIPDSPAAKAGFASGDVMLAVDGEKTATRDAFIEAVRGKQSGDRVRITLRRGDREKVIAVQLGDREAEGSAPAASSAPAPSEPKVATAPAARETRPSAPAGKGYLGLSVLETDRGILVDRVLPDSPAAKAGIASGDAVQSIGDHKIGGLGDLDKALQGMVPGKRVAIGLRGEQGTRSVMVELGVRPGMERTALPESAALPQTTVRAVQVEPAAAPQVADVAPAAEPSRPVRPARPARARMQAESVPAAPAVPSADAASREQGEHGQLREELRELRKELAELRRLLERLKKDGRE